jgi:hypothetical protein
VDAPQTLQNLLEDPAGGSLALLPHRVQKEMPVARSVPHVWQIIVAHLRPDFESLIRVS